MSGFDPEDFEKILHHAAASFSAGTVAQIAIMLQKIDAVLVQRDQARAQVLRGERELETLRAKVAELEGDAAAAHWEAEEGDLGEKIRDALPPGALGGEA